MKSTVLNTLSFNKGAASKSPKFVRKSFAPGFGGFFTAKSFQTRLFTRARFFLRTFRRQHKEGFFNVRF